MDKGEVTALTFIDLSAAFNTIDHVSDRYRISEQAEIWFPFLNARFNPLTSRPECMPGSRYTGVGVLFFVI